MDIRNSPDPQGLMQACPWLEWTRIDPKYRGSARAEIAKFAALIAV